MMFDHPDWPVEPGWVEGSQGRLFSLFFPCRSNCRGSALYLPPFAEDLNRCRNMAALQAREFAAAGIAVLILDLFGTGESEGDFEDASWETWLHDCRLGAAFLQRKTGHAPILWGTRGGALLAAELATDEPGRFETLLLWQPVTQGKSMLTQFLRIRVANLMDWSLPAETTKSMRAQMNRGESIEVTGYHLSPAVGVPLDERSLTQGQRPSGCRIIWLEHVDEEGAELPPAARKTVATLAEDNEITTAGFVGPPFWKLTDRVWAPDLVTKTMGALPP
jgi:exosortase A-associated hydrolase 2